MDSAKRLEEIVTRVVAESDTPDPHALASWVLAELSPRDLRPILAELLPDVIREYIRFHRASSGGKGITTSRRWADVQAMSRTGWFVPGKGWLFYEDLTSEDCRALAQDYFARAAKNEALGKEFLELADRLEQQGKARVGDLAEGAA